MLLPYAQNLGGNSAVFDDELHEFLNEFLEHDSDQYFPSNEALPKENLFSEDGQRNPVFKEDICDIRVAFARRYEASINSHDQGQLLGTLQSFCIVECSAIVEYPRGNPYGISYRELFGLEVIADFFHKLTSAAPDSIYLLHDAHLMESPDGDGTSVIICKFTATGSSVYTISAERDGKALPDHPAAVAFLRSASASSSSSTSSSGSKRNGRHEEEVQCTAMVVFKVNGVSKYDRYQKRQKTENTIGVYVDHSLFTEHTIRRRKENKTYLAIHNAFPGEFIPTHKAALSFHPLDVMVAGKGTKFRHSVMLPEPVKWQRQGIHKFYINKEHKVYKFHTVVQVKV